jgi:hypothetical protein
MTSLWATAGFLFLTTVLAFFFETMAKKRYGLRILTFRAFSKYYHIRQGMYNKWAWK